MTEIISRTEAVERGLKHYFTGKPCKRGHLSIRNTGNRNCVVCHMLGCRTRRKANPERYRERAIGYREGKKEQERERARAWQKANPEKYNAQRSKQRAAKLRRTVSWASVDPLWYAAARALTELLGEPYHVDHIIPLQGRKVSGLHVPNNLQLLSARENQSKFNHFEV